MKETLRGFKMDELDQEPAPIKEVFDWYKENFGFVPNLSKVLSASPAALRAYWLTQLELSSNGLLSPAEHNIIQMAVAVENKCKYCTAGHQMAGAQFFGSEEHDLLAIRNEGKIPSDQFDALRAFALEVYRNKGRIADEVLENFLKAGYSKAQAVEVITNIGVKVMSNFTNQLAMNEIDAPFAPLLEGLFENQIAHS